jgi:hypothetical protein
MWPFKRAFPFFDLFAGSNKKQAQSTSNFPVLNCAKCNTVYDFNHGAMINTYEYRHAASPKNRSISTGQLLYGSTSRPPEDTVMLTTAEVARMRRNILFTVLTKLRAGNVRKWYCTKCHHLQSYPKSFIART